MLYPSYINLYIIALLSYIIYTIIISNKEDKDKNKDKEPKTPYIKYLRINFINLTTTNKEE